MTFGERLRELREDKGITQKQLGALLGVSGRQVGNYEADNTFPRDEIMFRSILSIFDVSADYILGLSQVKNALTVDEINKLYNSLPAKGQQEAVDYLNYLLHKYS